MPSLRANRRRRWRLFGLLAWLSAAGFANADVVRLQARLDQSGQWSGQFSYFKNYKNGLYWLGSYENNLYSDRQEVLEGYVGYRPAAWAAAGSVVRLQKWSSGAVITSLGGGWLLNKTSWLEDPLANAHVSSFVQFFLKDSYARRGRFEVQHYYEFRHPEAKAFSIRGYNIFFLGRSNAPDAYYGYADFIHAFSSRYDVYVRLAYLSLPVEEIGMRHSYQYLGFRYNF